MKANIVSDDETLSGERDCQTSFSSDWPGEEERGKAAEALHSIRNRLTAIFGFAELAQGGSRQAQECLLHEIADRTNAICSQLDVIDAAVRCTHRFNTRPLNAG